MTCSDIIGAKGHGGFTRAERAAAVNHVRLCRECQVRVIRAFSEASLDAIVFAAETMADDRCDPEYMAALNPIE